MKHLITTASVAAIAALSAGAVHAADSAVESKAYTELAFPNDRGSKNYATVAPDASNGNGAEQIPTTGAAQGGRDDAVFASVETETGGALPVVVGVNTEADSAVESDAFTNLAYPDNRGSKNYATVAPDASNGNGAKEIPTTGAAQGGRDEAVYGGDKTETGGEPPVVNGVNTEADSAVESDEFTDLAFPNQRGSKNYATVAPDASNGNGAEEIPTASNAQGGRDEAVYEEKTVTQ